MMVGKINIMPPHPLRAKKAMAVSRGRPTGRETHFEQLKMQTIRSPHEVVKVKKYSLCKRPALKTTPASPLTEIAVSPRPLPCRVRFPASKTPGTATAVSRPVWMKPVGPRSISPGMNSEFGFVPMKTKTPATGKPRRLPNSLTSRSVSPATPSSLPLTSSITLQRINENFSFWNTFS